ncbi:MAG: 1-(5-phosphoribosyl)-5-[(5-phosphoribosylamino)methylideneamino]imidazole-4-carboxamide isomerase [Bacteroidales bacterium]|nr:1-(5-phosphoribosyl)-5-[(5-phosphoribosylamino)methylideneamino]imidazole-4-carboxamide isomerase [Bacteroidales bacterium]HPO66045.1 1-(5-phosphoribosyl)-5-[(5-phosphoribosylamino)methylideneamino]imidazole-4-carboxamide isomerase [Bacteroidales bacterium]
MITIIPAIDIIEGKCVRLSQGDYAQKKIYNDDPVEVAKEFEDYGFKRLHVVDLDGAKAKHVVNIRILEKIASKTDLLVDFGGGIKTDDDLQQVFDAGAHQATIGSIAVQNKELFTRWMEEHGAEKFILAADFLDEKIAIGGWQNVTDISLDDFIAEYESKGVQYVLCTDISKDGMLQGSSIEIYRRLHHDFPKLNIIASGGITFLHEIEELDRSGIYGVIIGKAIYEGRINLEDLAKFMTE